MDISVNRAILEEILPDLAALSDLHLEALVAVSRATVPQPTPSDQCVILLAAHGLNLYRVLGDLIAAGHFDSVAYLLRPQWDAATLLLATGMDNNLATRFLAGDLKPSDGRTAYLREARVQGLHSMAQQLDDIWMDDYRPLQSVSHTALAQLDKLVFSRSTGAIVPTVGGRVDADQTVALTRGMAQTELDALNYLNAVRGSMLAANFFTRYEALRDRIAPWGARPKGS